LEMRLWTLHPCYLDTRGLVALWREALLAKAVLAGKTKGYRHHPQLDRFRGHPAPGSAIRSYLLEVHRESRLRGFRFDGRKIGSGRTFRLIRSTSGQLSFEWQHLLKKLKRRDPERISRWKRGVPPRAHPLFEIGAGPLEAWERP